ncbi:fibrocystin [Spea bombifrons]|uniref:fibrocystin n=1 Tax=Spea bombifrons TaxID=233779 RepID=UPI002349AC55|nr:fibrocystin [Spea bombifrons]
MIHLLSALCVWQILTSMAFCINFTIEPREGSIAGGSWITILFHGCDQSCNNFTSFGKRSQIEVYMRNPRLPPLMCDVCPFLSASGIIKCKTRSSKEEALYQLDVFFGGESLKQPTNNTFKFSAEHTPVIHGVHPSAGTPGSIIEVSGWITTDQIESYDFGGEFIDGPVIMRSERDGFFTVCSLVNKDTQSIYPIQLEHGYGKLACRVEGNHIGSQNISFSVFNKGMSTVSKDSWLISAKHELFMFQTHSEILSVTPDLGSLAGGTDITIFGNYFERPAKVSVAGEPCEIKDLSPKSITCTTGPKTGSQKSPHPGNRGLLFEMWNRSREMPFPDKIAHKSLLTANASSLVGINLELDQDFRAKLSGFFVAPETNNYTFWIQADNAAQLYFSQSEDAGNKVQIASIPDGISAWSEHWELNWGFWWQQKSPKIELVEGKKYYMEMVQRGRGPRYDMTIGAQIHNTWLNPDIVNSYKREKHQIVAKSSQLPDIQILTVSGEGQIRFCWGDASSNPVPVNATSDQIQAALEDMLSVHCAREDSSADIFLHNGFEEGSAGLGGDRGKWTEPHCGRASTFMPTYLFNGSHSTVYTLNKYSHLCFAYKGYAEITLVVSFSYNNTFLNTIKKNNSCESGFDMRNTERYVKPYSGARYANQKSTFRCFLCFPLLIMRRLFRWKFGCVDLWDCLKSSGSLKDVHTESAVLVDQIALAYAENGEDESWFYVDDVMVTNRSTEVFQVDPEPAQPGGHFLDAIFIAGKYPTYSLTSLAGNCGIGLPLIELCNGSTVAGSGRSDQLTQSMRYGDGTIVLTVQRLQSASPPIGGTFSVHVSDVVIKGIPVDISPSRLRRLLIDNSDNYTSPYINTSDFTVTKDLDTCFHAIWTLSWTSRTGDLPNLFTVYPESLTGVEPSIRTQVIYDGGVFIWPILGDMLATANTLPQVAVHVNDIPAGCSGRCSFQHLPEVTSLVMDIQYTEGSGCERQVSITGSGYSEKIEDLTIEINQIICKVMNATRSQIICCVETSLPLGQHRVKVQVKPYGFAANSTGTHLLLQVAPSLLLVTPSSGPQTGGQLVRLRGIGFGKSVLVYFGSRRCPLNSSNSGTIVCTSPPQDPDASSDVDINMKLGEQWVSFPGAFKYDPSLNPAILSLNPNASSPAGDQELLITMSSFDPEANWDVKVMVHNSVAEIKGMTPHGVEVTLPILPTGVYNVTVTIHGIVIKSTGSAPVIRYVLNTFVVDPCCGSFLGGTIITIFGKGFSTNTSLISVSIGGQPASVITSTRETITCQTPPYSGLSPELDGIPAVINVSVSGYAATYINTGQPNTTDLFFFYRKDCTPAVSNFSWFIEDGTLQLHLSGLNLTHLLILNSRYQPKYKQNLTEWRESNISIPLHDFEAGRYFMKFYHEPMGYANTTSPGQVLELLPLVYSVSPDHGQSCGGTLLTISGSFFITPQSYVTVNLSHDYICLVRRFNFSTIECVVRNDGIRNISSPALLNVSVIVNGLTGVCKGSCRVYLSPEQTPVVNGFVPIFEGSLWILRFHGYGLMDATETLHVHMDNDLPCYVTLINDKVAECHIHNIAAGNHTVNILNAAKEDICFPLISFNFSITPKITSFSPIYYGTNGGGLLTIRGSALQGKNVTLVYIGAESCHIVDLNHTVISCIVPPGSGTFSVMINIDRFNHSIGSIRCHERYTPVVYSLLENNETFSLTVSGITIPENVKVFVGDSSCAPISGNASTVQCPVPRLPAGTYQVRCLDRQRGWASSNTTFVSPLGVRAVRNNIDCIENGILHFYGEGFSPGNTSITICGTPCEVLDHLTSVTEIYCSNWQLNNSLSFLCDLTYDAGTDCYTNVNTYICCDINIQVGTIQLTQPLAYVHVCNRRKCALQSVADTEDTEVHLSGLFISPKVERDGVLIYNSSCSIAMATEAEMECELPNQPITAKITEIRKNRGQNTQGGIIGLCFCSLWSENSSWPSGHPPLDGDKVTVDTGHTLLLDTKTSLLTLLHVKGGKLIFVGSEPVHLRAHFIIISHGGLIQAGTQTEPFTGKAQITLYGSSFSPPLYPYGVKFLAVRNGTLSLHGWVPKLIFTHLALEAFAYDTRLILKEPADWSVGDEVVICGVGFEGNRTQEEVFTIEKINATEITINPPLRNSYKVIEQFVDGRMVYLRPVVALLSRNVVVEGNLTEPYMTHYWQLLALQVRYISRCLYYSSERRLGSQDLGAALIVRSLQNEPSRFQVSGVRFEHMGKGFQKHLSGLNIIGNGNMSGSYIRRCTVLNSFARGLSISGVSHFKVEENVLYNIKGHGILLADPLVHDIEIKHNVMIRISSTDTLSNTEMIAPAAVYIRAPFNTIEENIACHAGYGFFYHLSDDGPSQAPLQSFKKNTAVSCLRFGFWLYPDYSPSHDGSMATFQGFSAWSCGGGAQIAGCGNVRFREFNIYSCGDFGINIIESTGNAEISDSLLLGRFDGKDTGCMTAGIKTPKRFQAFLSNITFMNFDHTLCSSIRTCSGCSRGQGGFTVKTQRLKFLNSPSRPVFPFPHSAIVDDLDGSFFGIKGSHLVASTDILPDSCTEYAGVNGAVPGSVCGEDVVFHRMSIGLDRDPESSYKVIVINRMNKSISLDYVQDTLSNQYGWLALLVDKETYTVIFDSPEVVNTFKYSATFDNFKTGRFILMHHPNLPDFYDVTVTCGSRVGRPLPSHPVPGESGACDWFFDRSLESLTYLVAGEGLVRVTLSAERRRPATPTAAPSPLPHPPLKWSLPQSWDGVGEGWGGFGARIPQTGDDVIILPNRTVAVDTVLPPLGGLYVLGTLEFPSEFSNVLSVACILIAGGELKVGSARRPLERDRRLQITLRTSEGIRCDRLKGLNISSGTIGVYGKLRIHSAYSKKPWTHLGADVAPGNEMIVLQDPVDWKAEDHIVISSSSYEPRQAEFLTIRETHGHAVRIYGNLLHRHTGAVHSIDDTWSVPLSAEVGLLTRNVQIKPDVPCSGRIQVGEYKNGKGQEYSGTLELTNVEISEFGSSLFATIHFENTSLPSSIISSSVHHGCGAGVQAVASANILLRQNVIFDHVGNGIHLDGEKFTLTDNLLVLMKQPNGETEWVAGIKMNLVGDYVMSGNSVAGTERIGFHVKGQRCDQDGGVSALNVAHSNLHGVHFYWGDGVQNCTKIVGFLAYKNYDYGLVFHLESSVMIENIVLLDNYVGILPVVSTGSSKYSKKYISIRSAVIVATSPGFDCIMDRIKPLSANGTARDRAPRSPLRGRVGILWPVFTLKPRRWPDYPWHMLASEGAVSGLMKLQDVTFSAFTRSCYSDDIDVCITSSPQNIEIMCPIIAERTKMLHMKYENMFYFHQAKRAPDCPLSMECYGAQKVLFKDIDGSSMGLVPPVTVFPEAGSPILQPCLKFGIYRKEKTCRYKPELHGHVCHQIDHAVVVLENIGHKLENVAPVISITDRFIDVFVNGNISQDHCCSSNPHSIFYSILPANKITKVCFSGPTPKAMRLQLNGVQNTTKLILALFYDSPQSFSIFSRGKMTSSLLTDAEPDFFHEKQGANIFNFRKNLLYVLLQGDEPVEIWANPSMYLALYIARGTSIGIQYLVPLKVAHVLGIDPTQITILKTFQGDVGNLRAMTDNHAKRKLQCPSLHATNKNNVEVRRDTRRNVLHIDGHEQPSNVEVILVEIGNTDILSTKRLPFLSYDKLHDLANSIISSLQTGELEKVLPLQINTLMVIDPYPSSVGGTTRNWTGSENDAIVYVRPYSVYIQQQPMDGIVGKPLSAQPKVTFLDIKGNRVQNLGSPSNPWYLSAYLKDSSNTALKGNTTVVIHHGWGNFTNLAISSSGSSWCLVFNVTSPPGVVFSAQSQKFKVFPSPASDKENIFMLVVLSSAASAIALLLFCCCFFKRKTLERLKNGKISK